MSYSNVISRTRTHWFGTPQCCNLSNTSLSHSRFLICTKWRNRTRVCLLSDLNSSPTRLVKNYIRWCECNRTTRDDGYKSTTLSLGPERLAVVCRGNKPGWKVISRSSQSPIKRSIIATKYFTAGAQYVFVKCDISGSSVLKWNDGSSKRAFW